MAQLMKLRLRGNAQDGERVQDDFLACLDEHQRLKWYVVWMLGAAGYTVSRGRKHSQIIADSWSSWEKAVALLLDVDASTMGTSRLSLHKRPAEDGSAIAVAEQEHWCSSAAVVALFLHWSCAHRKREHKLRSRTSLELMLSSVLSPADCEVLSHEPEVLTDACPQYMPGVPCQHVEAVAASGSAVGAPQVKLAAYLVVAYEHRDCPVVMQKLRALVVAAGTLMDAGAADWGEHGWEWSEDAFQDSVSKRRRLAERVGSAVVNDSVRAGRFATATAAARAMPGVDKKQAQRLIQKEVACYRESLRSLAATQTCVALAVDASRIGKPKEDVLLGAVSLPCIYEHGVAVPQVTRGTQVCNSMP